jgi:uncharacterized membrane protein YebE (DUF533 family)
MDESMLLNGVLSSVLGGGRRKKSKGALRYLTGGGRGSFFTNPTTLLTAAGLAWGIYETMQNSGTVGGAPHGSAGAGGAMGAAGLGTVGSVSSSGFTGSTSPSAPLPPLPNIGGQSAGGQSAGISTDAMRIVRLAISAANADGSVNDAERTAILDQARTAGVADVVEAEMRQPRPLAEIVSGVNDAGQRATLYVLAFSMVRGDEQPTGAERIYLAQLANLLSLDPATAQQLEQKAASRIETASS